LERRTTIVGDPNAAPFKNFKDFSERGQLFSYSSLRAYPVIGCPGMMIAVPDREADYDRLTPDQALALLKGLPDIRLVHRLTIIDAPCRYEPWYRQANPHWRMLGEVLDDSEIVLYRPTAKADVAATLNHEWAHLLEFAAPKWRRLFEHVGDFERFIGRAGEPEPESSKEYWATLGEFLLSTAPLISPASSFANPIRATIFAMALAERLASVPAALRGTEHAFYSHVLEWDRNTIRPAVTKRLKEIVVGSELERAVRAYLILSMITGGTFGSQHC
jgi:hypothetical protein